MKSIVNSIIMILLALSASDVHGIRKRGINPKIQPITKNGRVYSQNFEKILEDGRITKFKVSISARKVSKSKKPGMLIWTTELYQGKYANVPELVEVYLESIELDGKTVLVIDERKQKYRLEAETGKLLEPLAPVNYDAPAWGL